MPLPQEPAGTAGALLEQPQAKAVWIARQMKAREAEFTETQSVRVFCGTWNVNCKPPRENLHLWLDEQMEPDIYCIGFQEVDMSANALLLSNVKASAPWEDAVQATLGSNYVMLISKQLVGVLMMIFVKSEHYRHVHDLRFSIVGCGLLGVMGNKGGVAVRFGLYDSTFCFVNSHLAAQLDQVERRNQDYREIVRRIQFPPNMSGPELSSEAVTVLSGEALSIWEHDHLFWIGDLNYRISLPDVDVKQQIEAGDFEYLLQHDQLLIQKKRGAAFAEFEEGHITFAPTYRFDVGTDRYDTSEKKRTPAWCDRVQWRGADIRLLRYDRTVELRSSDHKPVTGFFLVKIKKVIPERKLEQQLQVMHLLDKLENDNMPDAEVSTNTLMFTDVRCGAPQTRSFVLSNVGQVIANFSLINKPGEDYKHKSYVTVKPDQGLLVPGEQAEIEVTVHVDVAASQELARGEPVDDILVLRIANGKDIFVLVTGNYMPSCFGATIDMLCSPTASSCVRQTTVPTHMAQGSRVPYELVRIIDYIYTRGMDERGLFTTFGQPGEMALIREYLDNGIDFETAGLRCDIHSMAESLIRFVGSLGEPVVPFAMYRSCLQAADDGVQSKRLIMQLPRTHRNFFVYLVSFLREVLRHAASNGLTAQDLAVVFGSELLRAPAVAPQSAAAASGPSSRETRGVDPVAQQRSAMFLLHFLQ